MIYWQLFITYLKIGFFNFGGGYAMLSLIEHEMVLKHQWVSHAEFTDMVAISQVTPGPIGINMATYVGYTVTGNVWGSMLATFAVSLPSLVVMYAIVRFIRLSDKTNGSRRHSTVLNLLRLGWWDLPLFY